MVITTHYTLYKLGLIMFCKLFRHFKFNNNVLIVSNLYTTNVIIYKIVVHCDSTLVNIVIIILCFIFDGIGLINTLRIYVTQNVSILFIKTQ